MNKTVNLYSYLRFCLIITYVHRNPNDSFWTTEVTATGMDTNGCDMPNDSKFALFWALGGVVGPHGGNMKNRRFVVVVILEIKINGFTCLLSSEGCDSFPKHLLDMVRAPNTTNEGIK